MSIQSWNPSSWENKTALQQPTYPDANALQRVRDELCQKPPLVFAGEVRTLSSNLAAASRGEAFLLQGGDCAESFAEFSAPNVRDTYRVLLQMAVVLTYGGGMPIVKLGRIAGQFAKPRSADMEVKNDVSLPSYRGDIINGLDFTEEARIPDPMRMLDAYNQSTSTLNLIRAFSRGGYADLHKVRCWLLDFVDGNLQAKKYKRMSARINEALEFMTACGVTNATTPQIKEAAFYTSHEALLLPYEQSLTRQDSTTGGWYDVSAHMLWIGERTRGPDDAHVEFLRGVNNPIGIKCGPTMDPNDLSKLLDKLNPENKEGRITLVARMGACKIKEGMKPLISRVKEEGRSVVWVIDPMHGNTEKTSNGYKTRNFTKVMDEVKGFFDVCLSHEVWPGGVHLEMTGRNVTECTGGAANICERHMPDRYETHCDPRLNASQSLELAFLVGDQLKKAKKTYHKRNNLAVQLG